MRKYLLFTVLIFLCSQLKAQPNLLPGIGIGALPSDNDSVCYIPWYLGSFYTSGLQAGDTAYDFTLYNLNGDSLNLETALSNGHPVLLIAASYTCPVYRGKVPVINDLMSTYAGLLDVYIIYTIEAHPDIDTSVYFGYVHTGTQNIQAGILYHQPTTYGERKSVLSDMLANMTTLAPVFIDGPCNNWWSVYGPAPNNAYLIDTNGIIFAKHGWFDRYPDNIYCDIDSLLGTNSGNCTGTSGTSNYTFQFTSADTVYDIAGTTISVDAELTNTGSQDILIYARRLENDMPTGWASSMCIDVCYSTSTDSVVFLLPAGATQAMHVYFFTSSSMADTGHVKMGFKNLSNVSNNNFMHAFGITTATTGISPSNNLNSSFSVFPNPATSEIKINHSALSNFDIEIFSTFGEKILQTKNQNVINVSKLNPGIYFLKIDNAVRKFVKE
ncbi:MAG: T9SS type A sorting domain-containing protein [Bacteroidia bacterium]